MATGTGSHDTVMGYMGYCLGLIDASNTHGTGLHGYLLDGWLVGWLVGWGYPQSCTTGTKSTPLMFPLKGHHCWVVRAAQGAPDLASPLGIGKNGRSQWSIWRVQVWGMTALPCKLRITTPLHQTSYTRHHCTPHSFRTEVIEFVLELGFS